MAFRPYHLKDVDGQSDQLQFDFVAQSVTVSNHSDLWVYILLGTEANSSVLLTSYNRVVPPWSERTMPCSTRFLSYMVSSTAVYGPAASVTQIGIANIILTAYDFQQSEFSATLPNVPAAPVTDAVYDTVWWKDSAAGGPVGPDTSVILRLEANDPSDTLLRIVGDVGQLDNYIEVLDSIFTEIFVVSFDGNTYTNGLISTFLRASNLTSGRVPIIGASGAILDDADLTFSTVNNRLSVTGGIVAGNLTSGRVALVSTSGLIIDDAGLLFDTSGNRLRLLDTDAQLEIGNTSGSNAPVIEFISNGQTNYGARIIVSGGTASDGTAAMVINAGALTLNVDPTSVAGELRPGTDNARDLGSASFRWKQLWLSSLTSGRIPIVSTSGLLVDDADLTFATDTLTVTKLVAALQANAATAIPAIVAPATQDTASDVTTSGTTEADVKSVTITNPPAAGRIIAWGTVTLRAGTVAADNFQIRLYFAGVVLSTSIVQTQTDVNGELSVTLVGNAAVANSGSQILKTTIQRNAGTGTVIAAAGQCPLTWIIIPGAGTTI